ALIDFRLAWAFFYTSKHTAKHNSMGSCSQCFYNVTGKFNSAISDDWNPVFRCCLSTVINGGNLRNTDTGNNACRTNRPGTDADLNNGSTCFDQFSCLFSCSHIAGNDI